MKRQGFWNVECAATGAFLMHWTFYEDAAGVFLKLSTQNPGRTFYLVFR